MTESGGVWRVRLEPRQEYKTIFESSRRSASAAGETRAAMAVSIVDRENALVGDLETYGE